MMLKIEKYMKQKGQGMIEYALIAAFICGVAAVVFGTNGSFSNAINTAFGAVSSAASSAATSAQKS